MSGALSVRSEYVPDVLDAFSTDHRGAAKFLNVLPLPSGDAAAADVVAGAAQLVVAAVFDELLALPRAAFPMPYYAAVLVSLCRAAPQTVPRALGRCVMRLYKRADDLDVALFDRLVRWYDAAATGSERWRQARADRSRAQRARRRRRRRLALHLSNLEFVWGWAHWAAALAGASARRSRGRASVRRSRGRASARPQSRRTTRGAGWWLIPCWRAYA